MTASRSSGEVTYPFGPFPPGGSVMRAPSRSHPSVRRTGSALLAATVAAALAIAGLGAGAAHAFVEPAPPTVTITSPVAGATVAASTTFTAHVVQGDAAHPVQWVQFAWGLSAARKVVSV